MGYTEVKAKKYLGQHFLNNESIAQDIVAALLSKCNSNAIVEIGPGMGVLTKYLIQSKHVLYAIDIDSESVEYLHKKFPNIADKVLLADFLKLDLIKTFGSEFSIIGNFPYNISSQIVFKIIEFRNNIPLMAGMFQKEVAERICAKPGGKDYGVISVITQLFYNTEYLFTVNEDVFTPPPKVKSGVMRMLRKDLIPKVNEELFFKVVKTAFNQRRKKLRNAIQVFGISDALLMENNYADKRAEQLSVDDFIVLTNLIENNGSKIEQ